MERTYYKVTCSRELEMAGVGLGYEEIYGGDGPRYFWDRAAARKRAAELNAGATHWGASLGSEDLHGTYGVVERQFYANGSFDDEYDEYAGWQLMGEGVCD